MEPEDMITALSPSDIEEIRRALDTFRREDPEGVRSMFVHGREWRPCVAGSAAAAANRLVEASLIEQNADGLLRSRFMIRHLEGRWLITDFPWRPERDSVFPLYPESEYFVKRMRVPEGGRALDLCTGCGIYAIFAAERARHVVAVDINPRALAFAETNLALNGVADRVELRQGDLFEPVAGERFDYICANPPFEPVPPGTEYYLHSDGGPDGLAAVRRLLAGFPNHLSNRGALEMVSFSLGGDGRLLLTDEVNVPRGFAGQVRILADPVSLSDFAERFRRWPGADMDVWLAENAGQGLSELYLLFLRCQRDAAASDPESGWEVGRAEERLRAWTDPSG
jgi:SAM-dependent methyltransferase